MSSFQAFGRPIHRDRSLADALRADITSSTPTAFKALDLVSTNVSQPGNSTSASSTIAYDQPAAVKAAVTALACAAAILVAGTHWLLMAKSSSLAGGCHVPREALRANVEEILKKCWRRVLRVPPARDGTVPLGTQMERSEPARPITVTDIVAVTLEGKPTGEGSEEKEKPAGIKAERATETLSVEHAGPADEGELERSASGSSQSETSLSDQSDNSSRSGSEEARALYASPALVCLARFDDQFVSKKWLLRLACVVAGIKPAEAPKWGDPHQRIINLDGPIGIACGFEELSKLDDITPSPPSSLGEDVSEPAIWKTEPAIWLPAASGVMRAVVHMVVWEWITLWLACIMFWNTLLYNGFVGGSTATPDRSPRLFLVTAYIVLFLAQIIYTARKIRAIYTIVVLQASWTYIFWSGFRFAIPEKPTDETWSQWGENDDGLSWEDTTLLTRPDFAVLGVLKAYDVFSQTPSERAELVTVAADNLKDIISQTPSERAELVTVAADNLKDIISQTPSERAELAAVEADKDKDMKLPFRSLPGTGIFQCARDKSGELLPDVEYEKEFQATQEADLKALEKSADAAVERLILNAALLLGVCLSTGFAVWTKTPLADATSTQIGSYALLASMTAAMGALFTIFFYMGGMQRSAEQLLQSWELALEPTWHSTMQERRRHMWSYPFVRKTSFAAVDLQIPRHPVRILKFWWDSAATSISDDLRGRILSLRRAVSLIAVCRTVVLHILFGPGLAFLSDFQDVSSGELQLDVGEHSFKLGGIAGYTCADAKAADAELGACSTEGGYSG